MMTLNFRTEGSAESARLIPSGRALDFSQLVEYLKKMRVACEVYFRHEPWSYSDSELVAAIGLPVRIMAKVVVLEADGPLLAILPAGWGIDIDRVKRLLGLPEARLATDEEVGQRFDGCDTGAIPPFGNVFNLPVCIDLSLLENDEIAFRAETLQQVIKLKVKDFLNLVRPSEGDIRLRPLRMAREP